MLDENLPTFFIKPLTEGQVQNSALYLSQYGSEPQPTYTLRRPNPALPASKNRYAVALFDSYNPHVLFGEILIPLEWKQPSLSAAELRRNGNTLPPPEPVIPSDFIIHLYAPDQEVHVRQKPGSWGGSGYWEFDLPQHTFRQPSVSELDRSQSDPAVAITTPKINFRWKRESKLSKDFVCLLSGKSTDPAGIKKAAGSKDPDIAVALFRGFNEVTIYEPNLSRVEIEDPKGLEVVLLLSAAAIRDVFFGNAREIFNISDPPKGQDTPTDDMNATLSKEPTGTDFSSQYRRRGLSSPNIPIQNQTSSPKASFLPGVPRNNSDHQATARAESRLLNASDQLKIDRETARLRTQLAAEERAKALAEVEEVKRIKKMLKAEEKEAMRRQAELDKESKRLKKIYGPQQLQPVKQASNMAPTLRASHSPAASRSTPLFQHPFPGVTGGETRDRPPPHLQPPPNLSFREPALSSRPSPRGHITQLEEDQLAAVKKKKSMFRLRSRSDDTGAKLNKKRSSMF